MIIFITIRPYLLPEVLFAGEQIEQVEVPAVEEQVDEAQHGGGAHHLACQVSEPHHRLDDAHRCEVKAWQGGDHWVPLHKNRIHSGLGTGVNVCTYAVQYILADV